MSRQPSTDDPSLTPKQLRAARALLDWSQKKLAETAGLAVSTVADFERGRRSLIRNNVAAILAALNEAGVTLVPEGAIHGPAPKASSAPVNGGGRPFRWITSDDLEWWAERYQARSELPELIGMLARAECGPEAKLHFPAAGSVDFSGWDGTSETDADSAFVPKGVAGWELKTSKKIGSEATEDFDKRTKTPLGLSPQQSAFIFVTPRRWSGKTQWVEERRNAGPWRDVCAYDADHLVHWIELHPGIGAWLAEKIGKPAPKIKRLGDAWEQWAHATRSPLSPALALSGRDEDKTAILQWLQGPPSVLSLRAETAQEVTALLYASITERPDNDADFYLSNCLVVETSQAAEIMADSQSPLTLVLRDPPPGLAPTLSRKRHHIVEAHSRDLADVKSDSVRDIARPSGLEIQNALIGMGLPRGRAMALARDSGRSLTILRRLMVQSAMGEPSWASQRHDTLITALLAGAWDAGLEDDKRVLATLGNRPYEDIERSLTKFTGQHDQPLRHIGSAWTLASPRDAWMLLARYLTEADWKGFERAIAAVLAPDRTGDDDETKVPSYSNWLRRGLTKTLTVAAVIPDRAAHVEGIDRRVGRIVKTLLTSDDGGQWLTLADLFPMLAEAAPEAFLDAVESALEREDTPLSILFKTGDQCQQKEELNSLFWALEVLAWSPRYFGRVADILLTLTTMDQKGADHSFPLRTARKLFLPWSPQTHTPHADRAKILEALAERADPDAYWRFLLEILPQHPDVQHPGRQPRWRNFEPEETERITPGMLRNDAEHITALLLEQSGAATARWVDVLNRITDLAPTAETAIERLTSIETQLRSPHDRETLRAALRGQLARNRQFASAPWALPADQVDRLQQVHDRLTPNDPVSANAWLFDGKVQLPEGIATLDWRGRDDMIRKKRHQAVAEVLEASGMDGVVSLAQAAQRPVFVGAAMAAQNAHDEDITRLVSGALASAEVKLHQLADGLIRALFHKRGESWAEDLITRARQDGWEPDAIVRLLCALPNQRWMWEHVDAFGDTVASDYWRLMALFPMQSDAKADDLRFAAERLIAANRPRDAVRLIATYLSRDIPSETLIDALEAAAPGIVSQSADHDGDIFTQDIVDVLDTLDHRPDTPKALLADMELKYITRFQRSGYPSKHLTAEMADRPDFFIEMVRIASETDDPETTQRANPEIAEGARMLLDKWAPLPGTRNNGTIDGDALKRWVDQARRLAKEHGLEEAADRGIGTVFSASPIDEDGAWPVKPVRDLIDALRSETIDDGFAMSAAYLRRGETVRGGGQESELRDHYRQWAQSVGIRWPRTGKELQRIADRFGQYASWWDQYAERSDFR